MNQKFFILLSVAIFYNGVIYASPVNNPETTLSEEKPPTVSPVTIDHNKTLEPAHAPKTPDTQKPVPFHQTEIPTIAHTGAISSEVPVAPHISEPKNVTHDGITKNATHDGITKNATPVISHNNSTLVTDGKNASQPNDNKNVTPVNGSKGAVPTGVPSSVSTSTLALTTPPSVVPEKPTTISITRTTLNISPTTVNTNTPGVTTSNSTTSDKVIVVHDVVTPVQEKHFDGPSFVGGIVLTIGLTAIGFIAFKYYKAGKIDMNYRTL